MDLSLTFDSSELALEDPRDDVPLLLALYSVLLWKDVVIFVQPKAVVIISTSH